MNEIHFGKMIHQTLKKQGRTVTWFAQELNWGRSNVYRIFERRGIYTELLEQISIILNCNFYDNAAEIMRNKLKNHEHSQETK